MWTNFFKRSDNAQRVRRTAHATRLFRPAVESLEGRVVMSATLPAPALGPALVGAFAPAHHQAAAIVPIVVNSVSSTVNGLVANATFLGQAVQIPLTLSVPAGQLAGSTTQILNLHLGEIHLDVLGLKVDTSEICLNISAKSGPGNLLGNLLTGVAHLLDNGVPLGTILGGLSSTQLNTLTTGLTGLLNGGLGQLTSPANAASGASATTAGTTSILHLEVGPLKLNLLGLKVNLDNCDNGPVTVDISAQPGPGNLLGNLLGRLLDSNANTHALVHQLEHIVRDISRLV